MSILNVLNSLPTFVLIEPPHKPFDLMNPHLPMRKVKTPERARRKKGGGMKQDLVRSFSAMESQRGREKVWRDSKALEVSYDKMGYQTLITFKPSGSSPC